MPSTSSSIRKARRWKPATAAFHRMVVDGVTVEHREAGNAIRGAQVSVVDFEDPGSNDWVAVNQFTRHREPEHPPPRHRAVRQRPAARDDRAEEPGGRGGDDLDRVATASDLQGRSCRRCLP